MRCVAQRVDQRIGAGREQVEVRVRPSAASRHAAGPQRGWISRTYVGPQPRHDRRRTPRGRGGADLLLWDSPPSGRNLLPDPRRSLHDYDHAGARAGDRDRAAAALLEGCTVLSGLRKGGIPWSARTRTGKDKVEGERRYTGSKDYNKRTKKFVESGKVKQAANDASPKSEQEAPGMQEAERVGKQQAKDEDPALGRANRTSSYCFHSAPQADRGARSGRMVT